MEINCNFSFYMIDRYTCNVSKASITQKDHIIKEFKGVHQKGKSHKDVQLVSVYSSSIVNYFPRGLQNHFPNLIHLYINGCGLKEISRKDLKGLERLIRLQIDKCQLTSLPDDLLIEMPNLRTVSFAGNKIEFASSEVLKPLLGRQKIKVDLQRNKKIDAYFMSEHHGSLKSLEELMKLIDEGCSKPVLPTVNSDTLDANLLLKALWFSGRFSDLTIIAGDKEFKVHKTILGMKSEVFAQILEDQPEATKIKLPYVSSKSVEALLKFIYTNEASEEGNAKENFMIAIKFKIAEMKSIYEKIICEQIDGNAWEIFLFAHRFSSQLLKEEAFRLIAQKMPELPVNLMEDPEKLKKLIDYRRGYEEMLAKSNLEIWK